MKQAQIILLISIGLLIGSPSNAQSSDTDKQFDKVISLLKKGKPEKATKRLEKLLKNNLAFGKGWDLLSNIREQEWERSKGMDFLLGGNIKVVVEGEGADDPKFSAENLKKLLNEISPSKIAYKKYINTLKEATLFSNTAYHSSLMLRNELVEVEVDTNVSKKALEYYDKAELAFQNQNYHKAAKHYQSALDEYPNFYKASLYLGDAYYFSKNYTGAIEKFKQSKEKFPTFLEPRKYLTDAYAKEGLYEYALKEVTESFTVYPDLSMNLKLRDAASLNEKTLNIGWTQRGYFPHKMDDTETKSDLIQVKTPWNFYRDAKTKISAYCNEQGLIVKENALTQSSYLEVFSWEEMLKNSNNSNLEEAKQMQELGYLDCYVLVSCFHQDFYDQYLHFVTNNKEKILEYFETFIE